MTYVLLVLKSFIDTGQPDVIRNGLISVPKADWTENMIRETLFILPRAYHGNLVDCIPEQLKTYKVWVYLCSQSPAEFVRLAPTNVATQTFYEDVVSHNPTALCWVPMQYRTTKLCMISVYDVRFQDDIPVLSQVPYESQTEELILAAVAKPGGYELTSAAFQTTKICVAAVEVCPTSIKWVNDQTYAVCVSAIRVASGNAGLYGIRDVVLLIRNHTPEICFAVLGFNPRAFVFLRNHSHDVCIKALRLVGTSDVSSILNDIREQTLELCMFAYRRSRNSYRSIHDTVLRQRMIRLIIANDILIPLHIIDLSTSLLTYVCTSLMRHKFRLMARDNPQLLAPTQLWALAAKVKHFV
ncbi:MAG: hypothetical protein WC052_04480 [Patescibacteria group bacterium]